MNTQVKSRPSYSLISLLALICAVLSFASNAGLGLLFAGLAIIAGLLGVMLALLPGTRGGIISVVSIVAGLGGIIAAIIKLMSGNPT